MKRRGFTGWLCALPVFLGGCDYFAQRELQPGVSSADDVRRLMGRPGMIWEENDGSQVLEYSRGPEGSETWMVEIGPDGLYRGMTDARAEARLGQVRAGMSRDDLRRLLGKPDEEERFPALDETVWTWRVKAGIGVDTEMFHAHLSPEGRVLRTTRSPDPRLLQGG